MGTAGIVTVVMVGALSVDHKVGFQVISGIVTVTNFVAVWVRPSG